MATNKIIVALDVDDAEQALRLVTQIKEYLTFFKVGSQLFTREGPDLIRRLRGMGVEIFLDLKMHDIPETLRKAVRAAAALDVRFLTIHTAGGKEMMEAALDGASGTRTQLLGVTVVTSMDDAGLREIGVPRTAPEQVVHLATLAQSAGMNGLVCSPLEIELIRKALGAKMTLVTPGIRSAGPRIHSDDQKRTLSAAEALRLGANHLVIGRPITAAPDPLAATVALLKEIGELS